MIYYFLIIFTVFSFFIAPYIGNASYIIHLKNGRQLTTSYYWLENQKVKFYIRGGTMAIEKDSVTKIEESPSILEECAELKGSGERSSEAPQESTKAASPQNPHEEVDLKDYQEKMAKLKNELNETLMRIEKATITKDAFLKDQAIEDNRKISAEMWSLTEELKQKNHGHLPADWWEGVGKSEFTR